MHGYFYQADQWYTAVYNDSRLIRSSDATADINNLILDCTCIASALQYHLQYYGRHKLDHLPGKQFVLSSLLVTDIPAICGTHKQQWGMPFFIGLSDSTDMIRSWGPMHSGNNGNASSTCLLETDTTLEMCV